MKPRTRILTVALIGLIPLTALAACGGSSYSGHLPFEPVAPADINLDPRWSPRLDPTASSMQPVFNSWSNTPYALQDELCQMWDSKPQSAVDRMMRDRIHPWGEDRIVTILAVECGAPTSTMTTDDSSAPTTPGTTPVVHEQYEQDALKSEAGVRQFLIEAGLNPACAAFVYGNYANIDSVAEPAGVDCSDAWNTLVHD